jgi:hypothetical protein
MLWMLLLTISPENSEIAGLSTNSAPNTDAGIQFTFPGQSSDSLQAEVPSGPVVAPTATPTVSETGDTERVQDVPVWGSIQTETGAVTHHDRVLFYSLSLNKSYETFSDPRGYFYIDRMTPATDYSMWVIPAGMFRNHVRKNLTISADQTEVSVVLGELSAGTLIGNLVNVDGDAVPGFGIKIRSSEKDQWAANFITDRFGNFQIDQVPFGTLEFSSTYGPASRITGHEFNRDLQLPLTLVVDHGSYDVNAMVLDEFNNPVTRANVVLNWVSTAGEMHSVVTRQRITDAAGRFSMKNIGRGDHDLMISATDGSIYHQTVDINSLSSDLTVFLRPVP